MTPRIAAFLPLLALGLLTSAHAAPLRFFVDTCSEVCSQKDGEVPASTEVIGSNSTSYLFGETRWRVEAATELGMLRAYAHGESIPIPLIPSDRLPPAVAGHAIGIVTDYISIVVPSHQPVPVTLELTLTGSCSGTDGTNFNGTQRSTCSGSVSLFFAGIELGLAEAGSTSTVRTLDLLPGDSDVPFELTYRIDAHGEATNGMFTSDFLHTAHVRVYTTAPGVSIVSQSGYDYANPVPVPAAAWLLLPMVGALLPWAKRKQIGDARPM